MARYYVEEPCEHGLIDQHGHDECKHTYKGLRVHARCVCPGGVRRELEDVQIVETDGYGTFARHFDEGRYAIVPLSGDTDA